VYVHAKLSHDLSGNFYNSIPNLKLIF